MDQLICASLLSPLFPTPNNNVALSVQETVVALVYFASFCSLVFPLLNPFLAMMSFAGYFHARFLLSAFFPVCLSYFVFPTVFVPDLFWCKFLYLVTTAGFVADQLIM